MINFPGEKFRAGGEKKAARQGCLGSKTEAQFPESRRRGEVRRQPMM